MVVIDARQLVGDDEPSRDDPTLAFERSDALSRPMRIQMTGRDSETAGLDPSAAVKVTQTVM